MNTTNASLKVSPQVTYSLSQNFFLKTERQMLVLGVEHKSTDSSPAVQWLTTSGQTQHRWSALPLHLLGQIPTF